MPPVVRPPNSMQEQNAQNWKLRALAQQQNTMISNGNGQMILNLGLVPGSSPAQYALALYSGAVAPGADAPLLLQLGQLPSGDYGLAVFNAAGDLLTLLDDTGVTLYTASGNPITVLNDGGVTLYTAAGDPITVMNDGGVTLYAANGDPIVELNDTGIQVLDNNSKVRFWGGLLPNGEYGAQVFDPNTNDSQTILPLAQVSEPNTTISSSSPTTSPDMAGPSVQATVGPSQSAKVEVSCYIGTTTSNQTGTVWVAINGTISQEFLAAGSGGSAFSTSCSSIRVLTGLAEGLSTFELGYASSNGSPVNFSAMSLIVTPL